MTLRVAKKFPLYIIFKTAVILLATAAIILSFAATRTKAESGDISWIPGNPTLQSASEPLDSDGDGCENQKIYVGTFSSVAQDACVYQADGFKYAITVVSSEPHFVIGFPSEAKMYVVNGMPIEGIVPSPESKDLIYRARNSRYFYLYMVRDLLSQLERVTDSNLSVTYSLKPSSPELLLKYDDGDAAQIYMASASDDGRWIVAQVVDGGLVRINTESLDVRWFSAFKSPSNGPFELPVSNNGKFVIVSRENVNFDIVQLDDSCGISTATFKKEWLGSGSSSLTQPCPTSSLIQLSSNFLGRSLYQAEHPNFDVDGGTFTTRLLPRYIQGSSNNDPQWVTFSAPDYNPPRLNYLALGDSYSSGEGDTEINPTTNRKYYRDYTDNEGDIGHVTPREKCHVSTRSYPYILAQGMSLTIADSSANVGEDTWNTITCSGATTWSVIDQANPQYLGQDDRLAGFNADELKVQALNEFIPGRQKQIEFVKKYKPKVITLTMGGNDIDFAGKLNACAGITSLGTCDYATLEWRNKLKTELQNQYGNLKSLYEELVKASNYQAKIYVLGYPQFINGAINANCESTLNLNQDEREMIVNSVTYLDSVIEQAARAAGVKYINIEASLGEHRLCDSGEKHVTAITNILGTNGNERQESFHPNAKGHADMASLAEGRLNNENLLLYDACPDTTNLSCPDSTATKESIPVPDYFNITNSEDDKKFVFYKLSDGTLVKGEGEHVSVLPHKLDPNTSVSIALYSQPTSLGSLTPSSDGSLEGLVILPATLPSGYHVLVLSGKTYSGEPIEIYQTVLVEGSNPNDIDENGILDSTQPCGPFLSASGIDFDGDGTDDACDPLIGPPKDPYRFRAGDPAHIYNGTPEHADYLYLERNIYATAKTGISSDYDPDHDGYAVIAATAQSGTNVLTAASGQLARTQIDVSTIPNVITISLRTKENGCVTYKPTDLSQVATTTVNNRTFTQIAVNTTTCRDRPVTDDLDNNGLSDNTQPLYMARNGDATKGENPYKLYLFRSTRAAEAQLGKSDYALNKTMAPSPISPTDTTDYRQDWSLIASTQSTLAIRLTYKKILMVGSQPYVLARVGLLGLCQAYKPATLGTIHKSTQATTELTLDIGETLAVQVNGGCS